MSTFDALVEVCNRSLSGVEPTSRADKYRVNVHLDTDAAGSTPAAALQPLEIGRGAHLRVGWRQCP